MTEALEKTITTATRPNVKKKQAFQRQARIMNIPNDVLTKVSTKKSTQTQQSLSPHFSPSSVPSSYASSPQSSGYPSMDNSQSMFHFVNYAENVVQQNPNTIIINNVPRDVNEVIEEIIKTRPPAPVLPKQVITYICPFSMVPITCPGRGVNCQHPQCFDIREYLLAQVDGNWVCPICNMPITFDDLRFDTFFFKISDGKNEQPSLQLQPPDLSLDTWSDFTTGTQYF